jgi:hypothetical protein
LVLAGRAGGGDRHLVVVEIERRAEARVRAQDVGRDGGAGRVPSLREHLRQRRVACGVETVAEIVADFVVGGEEAGEHGYVRRQRHRAVRVRVLEEDAVAAQRVDVRRLDFRVAIRRQAIGAQRVDGDEDDRRAVAVVCGLRLLAIARGQEDHDEQKALHEMQFSGAVGFSPPRTGDESPEFRVG